MWFESVSIGVSASVEVCYGPFDFLARCFQTLVWTALNQLVFVVVVLGLDEMDLIGSACSVIRLDTIITD